MSRTHLEQNDGLDSLSSEELEARAFGPPPGAPARSTLRGVVERPRPFEVGAPSATERRAVRANRRLRVAVGVLLAAVVGLSAALVWGGESEEVEELVGVVEPLEVFDPVDEGAVGFVSPDGEDLTEPGEGETEDLVVFD